MEKILVTGSAGFIGFHVSRYFLQKGFTVFGIDVMNDYYEKALKISRNEILLKHEHYSFEKLDLFDKAQLEKVFDRFSPDFVVHLAAQAGVRYSITNPKSYLDSNIIGTFNLLEMLKKSSVKHLLFASTSSIYNANSKMPFSEVGMHDFPLSFYSATKKASESMLHSYSHLYKIPTTILRFFTVYGPWGRPDMALFKFTRAMLEGSEIKVHNHGNMERDFTYIDDLTYAIYLLCNKIPNERGDPTKKDKSPDANWRIVNIGNSKPRSLMDFIACLEKKLAVTAKKKFVEIQSGEVTKTHADNSLLKKLTGFEPKTSIAEGIDQFLKWYKEYYRI